jgi:hypothetical protein
MPEKEPMHPEVEAALKAYEGAMLDGREVEIKKTLATLREVQAKLGKLARGGAEASKEEPDAEVAPA